MAAILRGDLIVVMSQRAATVLEIFPVKREDRNRASPSYARKLAEILERLGIATEPS